jgi:hypothetical protein
MELRYFLLGDLQLALEKTLAAPITLLAVAVAQ